MPGFGFLELGCAVSVCAGARQLNANALPFSLFGVLYQYISKLGSRSIVPELSSAPLTIVAGQRCSCCCRLVLLLFCCCSGSPAKCSRCTQACLCFTSLLPSSSSLISFALRGEPLLLFGIGLLCVLRGRHGAVAMWFFTNMLAGSFVLHEVE